MHPLQPPDRSRPGAFLCERMYLGALRFQIPRSKESFVRRIRDEKVWFCTEVNLNMFGHRTLSNTGRSLLPRSISIWNRWRKKLGCSVETFQTNTREGSAKRSIRPILKRSMRWSSMPVPGPITVTLERCPRHSQGAHCRSPHGQYSCKEEFRHYSVIARPGRVKSPDSAFRVIS